MPKERVLTLISIVSDVGADRGLMFCERGFQAGAIRSATGSNITLTSIADFEQNVTDEMAALEVGSLERRAEVLGQRFLEIWHLDEEDEREAARSRYSGPPDMIGRPTPITLMARLSQMREALESARFGRWPVWYFALDDETPISVTAWDGLLFIVDRTITTCERIYEQMVNSSEPVVDWRDLQPPELVELLEAIRASAPRP